MGYFLTYKTRNEIFNSRWALLALHVTANQLNVFVFIFSKNEFFIWNTHTCFLKLPIGCGLPSLTMAISQWKVQEFSSYSVHRAEYFSYFSVYVRTLKKQTLIPVKE